MRIPDVRFPERGASALATLLRYERWKSRPAAAPVVFADVQRGNVTHWMAKSEGNLIAGPAAAAILREYGIRGPGEALVRTADEAAEWARRFGYPVALKVASADILHKSDVGGVALDLADADAVRRAFKRVVDSAQQARPDARIEGVSVQQMVLEGQEVILGAVRDAQFGPLAMFGSGGVEVEGQRDVSFGLAPLSRGEAEEMVEATFAGRRLLGYRNLPPADREAAIDALLRLAQFAADYPQVAEVEINPLRVQPRGRGALALDVRIVLR